MPTKYPLREDPSCSMVKWKRINSQKIEFATHNSFEKGLKESIAQPSTPEVLALHKGYFRRCCVLLATRGGAG